MLNLETDSALEAGRVHPTCPSDLHVAGCRALGVFPHKPSASPEQQSPRLPGKGGAVVKLGVGT